MVRDGYYYGAVMLTAAVLVGWLTSPLWAIFPVLIAAFFLWFYLLDKLGATAASAYHFLMPPLGMFFGWLVLGEHLVFRDLVGIVPVALAIYLVTRPAAAQ